MAIRAGIRFHDSPLTRVFPLARFQNNSLTTKTFWTYPIGTTSTTRVTFFLEPDNGKLGVFPDVLNGRLIRGVYRDGRIEGYWVQNWGSTRCPGERVDGSQYYGKFWLEKKPGTNDEFIGKWGYCEAAPSYNWRGQIES